MATFSFYSLFCHISPDIIKFSIPGLFVGCTNFSLLRTHFCRTAIFLLLKASKPPSLQAPRRVTRSANNPPAHPKDERRRAGPLPIPYPFPFHILPKPFLTGLRVTLRGNRLRPLFFDFFSVLQFPLKMSIFWLPKGPKNPSQTGFWAKSWFPKSIFYAFFGRSCIFYVFYLFCDHFSMIFR